MCAFIAFFQGDHLKVKIKKICDGYKSLCFNLTKLTLLLYKTLQI